PGFRELPRKGTYTPSTLLRAEYCVVGRQGRESDLRDGVSWCLDLGSPLVDLIHGSWGIGKTRYALELCREMEEQDWICGFLREDSEPDALVRLLALDHPALLVVDYAETRAKLGEQLTRLAEESDGDALLKLLFLARGAGAWWPKLQRASADVQRLLAP